MPPKEHSPLPELDHKLTTLAQTLHTKKALNVHAMDVTNYHGAFEGLLLATAQGVRHAQALVDHLLDLVHAQGWEYFGMEGYQHAEWILIDLNDILVHIFLDESRRFYNLEAFWSQARKIHLELPEQENV